MNAAALNRRLFYVGFACVMFRQPIQYLFGTVGLVVLGAGLLCLSLAAARNAKSLRLSRGDFALVLVFLVLLMLHCILTVFGTRSVEGRSLWLAGLTQFLVVLLFLHYRRDAQVLRVVGSLFTTALVVECVIAFLQVTYYSSGFGLAPTFADYEELSFVSGSFFNANDLSVFVAGYAMATYVLLASEEKYARAYLIVGMAAVAVFVSISRTALVAMTVFATFVILRAFIRVGAEPLRKRNLPDLLALLVVVGGVMYFLGAAVLTGSGVYDRMEERMGGVTDLATDDSGSARRLVYVRLLENLGQLGAGTFADQNYERFFEVGDLPLMAANPHSFVAELAFLYGWLGLAIAVALIGILAFGILRNRELPLFIRLLAIGSLAFFQSVPSSVLADATFFLPYLFLASCRGHQLTSRSRAPSRARVEATVRRVARQ